MHTKHTVFAALYNIIVISDDILWTCKHARVSTLSRDTICRISIDLLCTWIIYNGLLHSIAFYAHELYTMVCCTL